MTAPADRVENVRTSGTVCSVNGLGHSDHLCWPHEGHDDFRPRALEFLSDGAAMGQRIAYVGSDITEDLANEVRAVDASAQVISVDEMYRSGNTLGPEAQVHSYTAATRQAVAEGYAGLRVAADATAMVGTIDQRDEFVRYEHLIDRAMHSMPFAALCGYDRTVLGDDVVAELACVHPVTTPGISRFQIFPGRGMDLAVTGEVDAMNAPAFVRALERTSSAIDRDALVVDATHLRFLDHRGIVALERLGRPVLVQHAPRVAGRLAALLRLRNVRVEVRT